MHNSSRQGSKDFSLYQASRIACLISDEVNIMRPEGSLRPSICTDVRAHFHQSCVISNSGQEA